MDMMKSLSVLWVHALQWRAVTISAAKEMVVASLPSLQNGGDLRTSTLKQISHLSHTKVWVVPCCLYHI